MKNYRLRLDEYTISAKESCMFTTEKEAQLAFLQQGIFGKVFLAQVFSFSAVFTENLPPDSSVDPNLIVKFFWICYKDDGTYSYIPLFYEDANFGKFGYDDIRPLTRTTLIYRNQKVYILSVDSKKRVNVRLLTLYYRQELIEILCQLQGVQPKEICLNRLCSIYDDSELVICWVIVHNVVDDKGEVAERAMYMPVNVFDGIKLYKWGLKNMDFYTIESGDSVEISGVLYNVEKTDKGKFVLAKKNLQIVGKKITQVKQYKEHCSKIVFSDADTADGKKFVLVPNYDLPKSKQDGKAVVVSLKKDEV